jgi:hypothetical protein
MACGRIGLDDTPTTNHGHPPRGVWFAECDTHGFSGQRRDRRSDALNDLLNHQAQFARRPVVQVAATTD